MAESTLPARKPTGTYLGPGTIVTVTVPPALVNLGSQVRVGAHSWNLVNRPPVRRLERATLLCDLNATMIEVASLYGGGIYIAVPIGAKAGVVTVTITGDNTTNDPWSTPVTVPDTSGTVGGVAFTADRPNYGKGWDWVESGG